MVKHLIVDQESRVQFSCEPLKVYSSGGIIRIPDLSQKPGWYYVSVDDQISEYYHWFYSRGLKKWSKSLNGCHMTFIAGERENRIVTQEEILPFLYDQIDFEYENIIYTNGRAFWLNARSPQLNKIREQLNLPPRNNLHITLGNIKNDLLRDLSLNKRENNGNV